MRYQENVDRNMSEAHGRFRIRNLSKGPLQKLVASLNAVHEGNVAIPLLFIAGDRAIRPLREILLRGDVHGLSIARLRVVMALAELGARNVLLEYLADQRSFADPVLQQAEDAVRNASILALAAWRDENLCQT